MTKDKTARLREIQWEIQQRGKIDKSDAPFLYGVIQALLNHTDDGGDMPVNIHAYNPTQKDMGVYAERKVYGKEMKEYTRTDAIGNKILEEVE